MTVEAKVQVGTSTDFLEGVSVTTGAGANLFREGVVLSDPDVAAARVAVVNAAPGGALYGVVAWIQGFLGLTDTQLRAAPVPVSAAALPLPTGAATSALQTQPGIDIGDVTVNNTAGAGAVNIQDAGNSLTVDAPVGTPVFTRLSDGAVALIGQKVMATSLPVALASDQTVIPVNGDIDHDVVNTLKNVQIAGHASPVDVPPAVVSANGDRVRAWLDRSGALVVRRRKLRESYTAVFRLAEAAARLDQTFTQVANTNKQWMTLHHTVAATKELRLMRWVVYLTGCTAATQAILELRQLSVTTPPATGNPAITPTPRRQAGAAAEAVALYLPTTQGSELAVNSPIASRVYDIGIMAAGSTVNPTPECELVLYDASRDDDEMLPPTFPVGAYAGLAVMLRTVGIPAVRMTGIATFTEEIP